MVVNYVLSPNLVDVRMPEFRVRDTSGSIFERYIYIAIYIGYYDDYFGFFSSFSFRSWL